MESTKIKPLIRSVYISELQDKYLGELASKEERTKSQMLKILIKDYLADLDEETLKKAAKFS